MVKRWEDLSKKEKAKIIGEVRREKRYRVLTGEPPPPFVKAKIPKAWPVPEEREDVWIPKEVLAHEEAVLPTEEEVEETLRIAEAYEAPPPEKRADALDSAEQLLEAEPNPIELEDMTRNLAEHGIKAKPYFIGLEPPEITVKTPLTLCMQKKMRVAFKDAKTDENIRDYKEFLPAPHCLDIEPEQRECIDEAKGAETCERAAQVFACVPKAMNTTQISELTNIRRIEAKRCIRDLESEGDVRRTEGKILGERAFQATDVLAKVEVEEIEKGEPYMAKIPIIDPETKEPTGKFMDVEVRPKYVPR